MNGYPSLRVVIDTNVLFEGLTQKGSASGLIIEACLAGLINVCVSSTVAYEYMDILARKLSEQRWNKLQPILGTLLANAKYVPIYFSWRPSSPDIADEHIIDCAMNSGAIVITWNRRDFKKAEESLGVQVLSPVELVQKFVEIEGYREE